MATESAREPLEQPEFQHYEQLVSVLTESINPWVVFSDLTRQIRRLWKQWTGLEVLTKNFNPIYIHRQIKEIQEKYPKEQADRYIEKFLRFDMETYFDEFVFKKSQGTYPYVVDNTHVTGGGYDDEGIDDICRQFLEQLEEDAEPISRAKVENMIYGQALKMWMQTAPDGSELLINSPPGPLPAYPGEDSYSMVFGYKIERTQPGQKRTVTMTWYRCWMTLEDHKELLESFGRKIPDHLPLTSNTIIAHPAHLRPGSLATLEKKLHHFLRNHPDSDKAIQVNQERYQAEFEILFQQFYLPIIMELSDQPQSQRLIKKFELALNFTERRLRHWIQVQSPTGNQEIAQMKHEFEEYAASRIDQTKRWSRQETEQRKASLIGLFGSLGKISSGGQCLIGTLVPLDQFSRFQSPLWRQQALLQQNSITRMFADNCLTCPACGATGITGLTCDCGFGRGMNLGQFLSQKAKAHNELEHSNHLKTARNKQSKFEVHQSVNASQLMYLFAFGHKSSDELSYSKKFK